MWLMLECHILYWTFVIYKKVKVVTFIFFPKVRYLQLYFLPLSPCSNLILSYLKLEWLIQQECIGLFVLENLKIFFSQFLFFYLSCFGYITRWRDKTLVLAGWPPNQVRRKRTSIISIGSHTGCNPRHPWHPKSRTISLATFINST